MKTYSKKGIIWLFALVYFTSYFARKDFAAVTAGILESGFITKDIAGLIGTAMFAMYGIGQVISGILGDKFSPKALILTGLATTCVCNILMPLIPIPELMIPVWGINGLAQAMLWPPIVRVLAQFLNHDEYVKGNLIVTSAAHISTILLYLYAPLCLIIFNWKAVFISAGILAAAVFVIFIIALSIVLPKEVRNTPPIAPQNGKNGNSIAPTNENFAKLLLRAGVFPIFGAIIMMGYLRDGIESWLPTLYAEAFNRDASESILISVVLPIFSIIAVMLTTRLHKRLFKNETFGASVVFVISLVLCVPLYFLLGSSSPAGRIICLLLAALICGCMHACNFLYISCLPGRFASHGHASGATGVCNACTYIGAAISTYGMASISVAWGWSMNIVFWGIISALGLLCSAFAYKRYTAFTKEENY